MGHLLGEVIVGAGVDSLWQSAPMVGGAEFVAPWNSQYSLARSIRNISVKLHGDSLFELDGRDLIPERVIRGVEDSRLFAIELFFPEYHISAFGLWAERGNIFLLDYFPRNFPLSRFCSQVTCTGGARHRLSG